jgi:hypothetical protein
MGKFIESTKNQVTRMLLNYLDRREVMTNMCHCSSVIMRTAEVQLTVEHQLPVLLYESYPIKILIKNVEHVDIHAAT